jgi:hypothetical protein
MKQKIKILSYDEFVNARHINEIPEAADSDTWDIILGERWHIKSNLQNYEDYVTWATYNNKLGRYLKGEN